jgi:hypothetical protein
MQSINFKHCVGKVNSTFGPGRMSWLAMESAEGRSEIDYFHLKGLCVDYGPRCKFYDVYLEVMYGWHVQV